MSKPSARGKAEMTRAVFLPFDLFGGGGAGRGVELLAEAFEEMLADNRREKLPTRARFYQDKVKTLEFTFESEASYENWRKKASREVRKSFDQGEFLLYITGNHLGALPVYEELPQGTLVLQFDAHLDIYNLSDGKTGLSHGNFLLHADGPLPAIINVGSRDLLLPDEHVQKYYKAVFPAAHLAVDPDPALRRIRKAVRSAKHVFIDIDCDVFDPAYFPAVSHPQPFGLSPRDLLRFFEAAWSEELMGVAISEFDPGRDRGDRSLGTLVWLLEHLLVRMYEGA
jgi:agmatinase